MDNKQQWQQPPYSQDGYSQQLNYSQPQYGYSQQGQMQNAVPNGQWNNNAQYAQPQGYGIPTVQPAYNPQWQQYGQTQQQPQSSHPINQQGQEFEDKKTKKQNKKANKKTASKKKKNKEGEVLPKTAQDTVPFINAYKNGIIESRPHFYTVAYKLNDINFNVAPQDEQEIIFKKYGELLNMFSSEQRVQIVLNNRNTDEETLLRSVMAPMRGDGFDLFRTEMNNMLANNLHEGKNNLVSEKYLVVGQKFSSIKEAKAAFDRIGAEIDDKMRDIAQTQTISTPPQTINARLKTLHDIMNTGNEHSLPEDFDYNAAAKQGISVKDIICPTGFKFERNHFLIGDKYASAMFIRTLPANMTTDFMTGITNLPFNLVASFYMRPIRTDEGVKLVSRQLTNIRSNVIEAQKQASKNGYSTDLIAPGLQHSRDEAQALLDEIRVADQRLFYFTAVFMLLADSLDELQSEEESLIALGNRHMCSVEKLLYEQEAGFRCALPLCRDDVHAERLMTTDSMSLFIPFTSRELTDDHGMYYGLNAVTHNMLLYNRLKAKNQNGLILGQPGSGKSFAAKREMINVFLNTEDEIYIIDPESEYTPVAKMMGGSVIHLEPGTGVYINPFDMDIHYGDDEDNSGSDPVTMKSDYICMLCETALGRRYELTNVQRSIIDRCVIKLYEPYLRHMEDLKGTGITCDTEAAPTMMDFYNLLMDQDEQEAINIALALEIYCKGTFDTFAHRTNVDVQNRFTVYDIKDIGSGMKEMGLQVCLNHVWNKIISNKAQGKRTWFYIDEFHILTKTRSSAEFLQQIWKRARKWGGVPTAITQNVRDMLTSEESQTIIANCEFIMMMSQSPMDGETLRQMYHISNAQMKYITNSPPGQGLIYTGDTMIPFEDHFPKDTHLYKIMTTTPGEMLAAEKQNQQYQSRPQY